MSGEKGRFLQGRRVLAFIILFETFSLLIHLYVFSHLFYLLDIQTDGWFWVFIIIPVSYTHLTLPTILLV